MLNAQVQCSSGIRGAWLWKLWTPFAELQRNGLSREIYDILTSSNVIALKWKNDGTYFNHEDIFIYLFFQLMQEKRLALNTMCDSRDVMRLVKFTLH